MAVPMNLSRLVFPAVSTAARGERTKRHLDQHSSESTGTSGSGKPFLLEILRQELGQMEFGFFEGSEVIASLVPDGLDAFRQLDEEQKADFCGQAINKIGAQSASNGKVAIVTRHLMVWFEKHAVAQAVYTLKDLDTFTHIIYHV